MLVVHTVPAFSDNYLWLFHRQGSNKAYVVDPGDAAPIKQALTENQLVLEGILVTHQHPDHIGGIPELLSGNEVPVYGPADISLVDHPVHDGDKFLIDGVEFTVMAVPGHTLNHLAYFSQPGPASPQPPVLFCGDTLFAAGCGRLFEGTAEQMYESLQKIADLPPDTEVYCAHEYTIANLNFALAVDADNTDLQQRMKVCTELRRQNRPTVPFALSEDLKTNPFLRCNTEGVVKAIEGRTANTAPAAVFAAVRKWKDNF